MGWPIENLLLISICHLCTVRSTASMATIAKMICSVRYVSCSCQLLADSREHVLLWHDGKFQCLPDSHEHAPSSSSLTSDLHFHPPPLSSYRSPPPAAMVKLASAGCRPHRGGRCGGTGDVLPIASTDARRRHLRLHLAEHLRRWPWSGSRWRSFRS